MEVLLISLEFMLSPIAYHMFIIKAIQKLYKAKTKNNKLF